MIWRNVDDADDPRARDREIERDFSVGDLVLARQGAAARQAAAVAHGWRDRYGPQASPEEALRRHVVGCVGELGTARCFCFHWDPTVGRLDAKDVGPLQVRTTSTYRRDFALIVGRTDPEADLYIAVALDSRRREYDRLILRGWLPGRAAKSAAFFGNRVSGRDPAYYVPPAALRPFTDPVFLLYVLRAGGMNPAEIVARLDPHERGA